MNDAVIVDDYPYVSDTGKRYQLLEDGGRLYASGTEVGPDGKIRRGPINNANAMQMQAASVNARYANQIEAARRGLVVAAAAEVPGITMDSPPEAVWGAIVGQHAMHAMDPAANRSVDSAKFVGLAADLLPDRRATASALPDGVAMQLNLTDDAAAMLADAFAKRRSE